MLQEQQQQGRSFMMVVLFLFLSLYFTSSSSLIYPSLSASFFRPPLPRTPVTSSAMHKPVKFSPSLLTLISLSATSLLKQKGENQTSNPFSSSFLKSLNKKRRRRRRSERKADGSNNSTEAAVVEEEEEEEEEDYEDEDDNEENKGEILLKEFLDSNPPPDEKGGGLEPEDNEEEEELIEEEIIYQPVYRPEEEEENPLNESEMKIKTDELNEVMKTAAHYRKLSTLEEFQKEGWKLVFQGNNFSLYKRKRHHQETNAHAGGGGGGGGDNSPYEYLMKGSYEDISPQAFLRAQILPEYRKMWDTTTKEMLVDDNNGHGMMDLQLVKGQQSSWNPFGGRLIFTKNDKNSTSGQGGEQVVYFRNKMPW